MVVDFFLYKKKVNRIYDFIFVTLLKHISKSGFRDNRINDSINFRLEISLFVVLQSVFQGIKKEDHADQD